MPRTLVTGGSGFIGTNLLPELVASGAEVVNLDSSPPLDLHQAAMWAPCDIRDADALRAEIFNFRPTHVIHLAAEARVAHGWDLSRYDANTTGTANVLSALSAVGSVTRAIITSTQYVCRPGYHPTADEDYEPHTVYGYSKVVTESLTRRSSLPFAWCIIRPTTIWGPWDIKYRRDFYWSVRNRWYLHPRGRPAVRSMGFVGNLVQQLVRILEVPDDVIHGRTFYVGDEPAPLDQYVDAFAERMTSRQARRAPRSLMAAGARGGDFLQYFGLPAPLTTKRYHSMIDDYEVDVEPIQAITGKPRYALRSAVDETVAWLESGDFEQGWQSWRFA